MSWNKVPLSSLVELITKGTTPTSVGYDFTDSGINFIKIESINLNGNFIKNKFAKIDKKCNEALKRSQLKEGDILFSIAGALGRTAIVTKEILPANTNQALAIIRLKDSNLISKEFLIRVLTSESILNQVSLMKGGVAQQNLSLAQLKDFLIPLPSLAIQQKIVAKLDAIFAEIDTATAAAETNAKNAEALYKSFLIELFTRKSDDSKVFNLSDLCLTLHQGLNTAGEKVKFYDSGFPIIQTRNIDNGIIDVSEKLKFLSNEDWEKYKDKFKPELGDVFFTNIGTIGKTAIVTNVEDYLIHWNIFKIRPKFNLITSKFMKLALDYLTLSGYFSDRQKGGTVEFVTKKMISEVSLSVPLLKSQIELTNKNDSIFEFCEILRESYHKKLNELNMLKQSILQKVFSGELVKE